MVGGIGAAFGGARNLLLSHSRSARSRAAHGAPQEPVASPIPMRNATTFAAGRRFDIICLGRLAVDFYAEQIGARLADVTSFAKYLGGSSANTAFGCARLGLKAAMASRIGDDAMGEFLVETLARAVATCAPCSTSITGRCCGA
jgi:hypothetical protein